LSSALELILLAPRWLAAFVHAGVALGWKALLCTDDAGGVYCWTGGV
jgi:hypothetical protein